MLVALPEASDASSWQEKRARSNLAGTTATHRKGAKGHDPLCGSSAEMRSGITHVEDLDPLVGRDGFVTVTLPTYPVQHTWVDQWGVRARWFI